MASQTTPNLQEPTAISLNGESRAEELFLPSISTIEDVIHAIASFRQRGTEELGLKFHWKASKVEGLSEYLNAKLAELDQPKVRHFEYDYETEMVSLEIMSESVVHGEAKIELEQYLEKCLADAWSPTNEDKILRAIQSVIPQGTTDIKYEAKLWKQPDVSFGVVHTLPSLVCEVSWSETRQHAESKARDYIGLSDGKIQAVLIIDLEYPDLTKAWFSLLVSNGRPDHWVCNNILYHDDNLDQQPAGQVGLYLSDFVGFAGLPASYCRPSAAELDAGITRIPTVILTYDKLRSIFRWARYAHDPAKFTIEVGDEPQNPYLNARLDMAEKCSELEQRMEQQLIELRGRNDRELERWHIELRERNVRELKRIDSEIKRKERELEQLLAELEREQRRVKD
ncbi:hypothetical protein F5144DRAFT_609588 [Chaetomium tenue]|uniref:Uncharacterized protein n=1 Tax=Chaetomium tenue TaxID=1854479 RepID=A0ACB7PFL8_9PEZI|nr:hypothetical protein F5144DRAFT_609588 [Chaetomium globosum]